MLSLALQLMLHAPPALRAPSSLQLALPRANNALAATTVLLAPLHGLVAIADAETIAPMALALPRPAPTTYPQLADGVL